MLAVAASVHARYSNKRRIHFNLKADRDDSHTLAFKNSSRVKLTERGTL
jgi:hypothetical protein